MAAAAAGSAAGPRSGLEYLCSSRSGGCILAACNSVLRALSDQQLQLMSQQLGVSLQHVEQLAEHAGEMLRWLQVPDVSGAEPGSVVQEALGFMQHGYDQRHIDLSLRQVQVVLSYYSVLKQVGVARCWLVCQCNNLLPIVLLWATCTCVMHAAVTTITA